MSEKQQYHINSKGDAKPCKASVRGCRFSKTSKHYDTLEDAQQAAEQRMNTEHSGSFNNTLSKGEKKNNKNISEKIKEDKVNLSTEEATDAHNKTFYPDTDTHTYPMQMKASQIKAGDIVFGEKFTPGGKWVEESKKVKSVESKVDLDLREKKVVTYDDGNVAEFVASAPIKIRKPLGYVEGRDTREMEQETKAIYKKIRNGKLTDEDVEKVIENMNDPNASDRMSAYAKQVAYHLEDINNHEPVIRIDAAIERQRLANDSDAKIEKHMSLIYDEKTPDNLFKRAVEEKPEAFQKAKNLYEGYGKEWNRYI